MNKQTPLAIVGIGCLFPKASNLQEFWSNVKRRVDGITEVPATHWSPSEYFDANKAAPDMTYARRGGFLSPVEFDAAEFGISPNTLEATDAAQLLGLVAAQMALRDAGYGPEKEYDKSQVSVILGVTGTLELVVPLGARLGHPIWRKALAEHGIEGAAADSIVESIKDGYVPWQENSFPGLLGNVVAGRIANRFNLGGTNCVVDAACASSLSAAHLAALELESGRSKMVITGGVDCFNDIFMYMCFSKTPALSPTGDAKPFDKKADGTILGEGLGMVVLKRLEDAEKDGDRVYAVLKGVGSSSDGRGKSIYAPSSEGQTKALKKAYELAGVSPATVELVEAHGTGTTVGDGVEVDALKGVYSASGRDGQWCALGSVKSMVGHTKAAAGSAAMIKAAMALYHKVLPPTIKVDDPILQLKDSPFYLNTLPRPWPRSEHPRRAACSALGFGGSNFHAVLEEHKAEKPGVDWDHEVQIVVGELPRWKELSWDEIRLAAYESRKNPVRGVVCVFEKGKGEPFVAKGDGKPGKLGVLFAGQGSQYVGMNRDLSCQFPEALATLEAAEKATKGLTSLIYPPPLGDKEAQELALRSTDAAQPALGAVALSQWKILSRFGLKADAFAGHSYGELPALWAAGRLTEEQLHSLSALRGALMKQGDGGRGAMLAVAEDLSAIERMICDEGLDLIVANRNAAKQNVLSGAKDEIEKALKACEKRGWRAVKLPVSAAFHSPLVAGAVPKFRAALESASFEKGGVVYADKTAQPYPADAASCRALLASQLESPVEFAQLVENMRACGVTHFLEVGPGARLTGLVGAEAIAVDSSNGKRHGVADLARVLAQLAAWGYAVDLSLWDGGEAGVAELLGRKKARMPVQLTGANYRSTKPKPRTLVKPTTQAAPAPAAAQPAANDAMTALLNLQRQTAELHQKFLENQMATAQALAALAGSAPLAATPKAAQTVAVPASQPAAVTSPAPKVESGIEKAVLSVVAEKTGYPVETLNADMDLESDLGIDSIKRVEIMSALAQKLPEAPKAKPEHLGTLRTLRKIVEFLSVGNARSPEEPVVSSVEPVVLGVVAEKTGYPLETLNLDMDLESDLGIDSIKRVEIMSALAQKLPDAPKAKPEHLGTLRTLRKIVEFLSAATAQGSEKPIVASVEPVVLGIVSEKTGYPLETLSLDMDLESDLGIDSIKRVEIMSALAERVPGAPKAKPEHLGTLRTLRKIAEFVGQPAAASAAPAPVVAAKPAVKEAEAPLSRLVLRDAPLGNAKRPAVTLKGTIAVAGDEELGAAVVEKLTTLGFSARWLPLEGPLPENLGGLVVIAPARRLEPGALWTEESEAFAKAAFALACRAARPLQAAKGVFATVARLDGTFGLGGLTAEQDPISGALAGLAKTAGKEWAGVSCKAMDAGDLPAADLIVEELLLQGPHEVGFTGQGKRALVLEDRPISDPAPGTFSREDVVLVTGGARGVTAAAALELAAACKPTIVLWGRTDLSAPAKSPLAQRQRAEIEANLKAIEAAGAKVIYEAVDVRNAQAVRKALADRKITALIHGAGVLADKKLEDKTAMDAVWDTKVGGLKNVLSCLDLGALKAIALFSSSTARYGRVAQGDYAMANEALNKISRLLSRRLPAARVASIGWGPWDGGMVNDSLKALFAAEGVGVIGLKAGARLLLSELSPESRAVELVVLAQPAAAPVFERTTDWPILQSHVLRGQTVVPVALMLEMMAHAALHGQPGYAFAGVDELRVLKGAKGTLKLSAVAGKPAARGGLLAVPVELRGDGRHATATVLLGKTEAPAPMPALRGEEVGGLYGNILFHGTDMRFIETARVSEAGVEATVSAAKPPRAWLGAGTWRDRWIADPAALDAAFQAMIVWTTQVMGAPSLPSYISSYRQFGSFSGPTTVRARAARKEDGLAGADIDFLDGSSRLVARLEGYECTVDASLKEAFSA